MRRLKFHEKKLLRKENIHGAWKGDNDHREIKVMRRYHLQEREDYDKYNKICGLITQLVCKLKVMEPNDQFRIKATEMLTDKLYNIGLINSRENIVAVSQISVSAFCRRRLPVVMQTLKFSQTLKEAITFIEQGHIRVGTEVVTNPATIVTRNMEDHIKWVDGAIKKKILTYQDKLDDYDLLD